MESFLADIVRMKGIACCRTYFELEPTGNKVVQCCAIRTIIEVMWWVSDTWPHMTGKLAYVRTLYSLLLQYALSACYFHPGGWRGWMAWPLCAMTMTESPLWHQVLKMWWVGGAPESAESDQGGSPGDRIFTKHLNTDWHNCFNYLVYSEKISHEVIVAIFAI